MVLPPNSRCRARVRIGSLAVVSVSRVDGRHHAPADGLGDPEPHPADRQRLPVGPRRTARRRRRPGWRGTARSAAGRGCSSPSSSARSTIQSLSWRSDASEATVTGKASANAVWSPRRRTRAAAGAASGRGTRRGVRRRAEHGPQPLVGRRRRRASPAGRGRRAGPASGLPSGRSRSRSWCPGARSRSAAVTAGSVAGVSATTRNRPCTSRADTSRPSAVDEHPRAVVREAAAAAPSPTRSGRMAPDFRGWTLSWTRRTGSVVLAAAEHDLVPARHRGAAALLRGPAGARRSLGRGLVGLGLVGRVVRRRRADGSSSR